MTVSTQKITFVGFCLQCVYWQMCLSANVEKLLIGVLMMKVIDSHTFCNEATTHTGTALVLNERTFDCLPPVSHLLIDSGPVALSESGLS